WLGPAGAALHLMWIPAWWIEGLAESLSVSQGSAQQASYERFHALTGSWPTYDRLHSLYQKRDWLEEGYATSGALVAYSPRSGRLKGRGRIHRRGQKRSMPWWGPWAAIAGNGFMPMDGALERAGGAAGATL